MRNLAVKVKYKNTRTSDSDTPNRDMTGMNIAWPKNTKYYHKQGGNALFPIV